jgi:hypothetical protein
LIFRKISVLSVLIFILYFGCAKSESSLLKKYEKNPVKSQPGKWDILYQKNLSNMNNGYPFYVIRPEAPVLCTNPADSLPIPGDYFTVGFGDVLYPVRDGNSVKNFFHVRTIDGKFGWVESSYGISLNYDDDPNLYFFNRQYYLARYAESKGNIDNPDKIILIKNFVPMLLENFKTEGFFYPPDPELALILSEFGLSISTDQDTLFHAASAYDWSVNEIVVSNNLVADCLQKLSRFDDAIAIHEKLIKNYFWKSSDNSPIGGLNSVVKLEKLYLEVLKTEKAGSENYKKIQKKIVDDILITGNSYNIFTIIDLEWHLSSAEWLLAILRNSLERKEFFTFCDMIAGQTTSKGFADLVMVYKAVELYKDGDKEKAFKIFSTLKLGGTENQKLKLEDWLSAANIIPDSVIYQYNF